MLLSVASMGIPSELKRDVSSRPKTVVHLMG